MIGKQLSHYSILREIGSGGMGVVYLARDEHLQCEVALKVLPAGTLADDTARRRFRHEALALAKRAHPNLVAVRDFDTQDDIDFLVMENVEGPTLHGLLEGGSLPQDEIFRIGIQLASGIAAAHGAGVIHRDIKPGNLKITPDGIVKILDFGLAKIQQSRDGSTTLSSLTEFGSVVGTLPYLAPEVLHRKPADARSDIYSAGVVLYEMAAGRRPHVGATQATLIQEILTQIPPPPTRWNASLSPSLESVILKAIDKDPARRYQSAAELEVDLKRAMSAPPILARGPRRLRPAHAVIAGVALTVLVAAGILFRERLSDIRPWQLPASTSLAVLPLDSPPGEAPQEYFADGMTEELITALSKISRLDVISHTSAMTFKGSKQSLPVIAGRLGVRWILEGSVVRENARVRINVRLVDARKDQSVWAQGYEGDFGDALTLQAEVAQATSREINVATTPKERERLAKSRTVVPAALDAYLQGLSFWNRRGGDVPRAIESYQRAIQLDPGFAKPYAGLADAYAYLGNISLMPQGTAYGAAKASALRALELDPDLGEAHVSVAVVKIEFEWDWVGAEREFLRAIELNPGNATAHQWYAEYLSRMGRDKKALVEIRRALELDPLSGPIRGMLGTVYYYDRQFDKAIDQYRITLEANDDEVLTRFYLGLAYLAKADYQRAIPEFELAVKNSGGLPLTRAGLGCAYGMAGRRADAAKILDELRAASVIGSVRPTFLALVSIGLGDKDQAIRYLEDGYRERDSYLGHLKVAAIVDGLRSDPRFKDLLNRLGLDGDHTAL